MDVSAPPAMTTKQKNDLLAYAQELRAAGRHAEAHALLTLV